MDQCINFLVYLISKDDWKKREAQLHNQTAKNFAAFYPLLSQYSNYHHSVKYSQYRITIEKQIISHKQF